MIHGTAALLRLSSGELDNDQADTSSMTTDITLDETCHQLNDSSALSSMIGAIAIDEGRHLTNDA
jgi:hypothetical protein